MPRTIAALALVPLLAALPAAARADALDVPCGATAVQLAAEVAPKLEGRWAVEHNAGYVVTAGMVMPHPASNTVDFGRFELQDGKLVLIPESDPSRAVTFDWVTDERWNFDSDASLPEGARVSGVTGPLPSLAITDEDVSLLSDCPSDDLPRLVGRDTVTIDGVTMTFTLRLLMIGPDVLYGFQQVDANAAGMPVMERRTFVMSRA